MINCNLNLVLDLDLDLYLAGTIFGHFCNGAGRAQSNLIFFFFYIKGMVCGAVSF